MPARPDVGSSCVGPGAKRAGSPNSFLYSVKRAGGAGGVGGEIGEVASAWAASGSRAIRREVKKPGVSARIGRGLAVFRKP